MQCYAGTRRESLDTTGDEAYEVATVQIADVRHHDWRAVDVA